MAESESGNAAKYNVDDEITVSRGTNKNRSGKVLKVDTRGEKYLVEFSDGDLALVNFVNVRPKGETVLTASQYAEYAEKAGNETELGEMIEQHFA